MNFDKFNAIVENRLNYGELDEPSVVSEYKNAGCGDGYRLFLNINNDNVIEDAAYTTTGCSFSLVSLGIICDLLRNKTVEEARNIKPEDLEPPIDGYPERRKNYAETAVEAANKALDDFINGTGVPAERVITRSKALDELKEKGNLRDASLASVMLDGVDLKDVDFTGANMQNAFLKGADLEGAILDECNLKGAFLNEVNLKNASIKGADLRFTKLTGAELEGADFTDSWYDIGTRVNPKDMHIFDTMNKKGKEIYIRKDKAEKSEAHVSG